MDRQTDLYFEVDEQTDRQTAGQTELRNCYIDYNLSHVSYRL